MDLSQFKDVFSGVAISTIVWPVVKFCWDKFRAKAYITGGAKKIGNLAGLKVYDKVIRHISDDEAKAKVIETLDESGNELDKGWDLGIHGEKI